jgi:hypothetical protein
MLTAMTSQRAALRRSDDVVETRRAASFDAPTREVPPDSKRLPPDSVAVALILWIIVELAGGTANTSPARLMCCRLLGRAGRGKASFVKLRHAADLQRRAMGYSLVIVIGYWFIVKIEKGRR